MNREETAPICVWDTSAWKLKKRLNFHYKGVQIIKFSNNGKYMISAGNKQEKSICIWNFANLTVIDSKSLKFQVIDLMCEKANEPFLYFTTLSFNVVSFWRMDTNFRLEGFHIRYDDLTNEREENEVLTAIEVTPYYEKVRTSFVLIGTNTGAILILDKEKKLMIRKYYISKCPITKIIFFKDTLICGGESPIVYSWKINSALDNVNVFDFLEKDKSDVLFVDGHITSLDFKVGESYNEGLIGTDNGSIFFANLIEKATIKIISSHTNCLINTIDCDINDEYILTSGDDGTVRCWTADTFDSKFQFIKINEKCTSSKLNPVDNILVNLYNNSYIRVYNMNTLKSVGKIKIPENDINFFGFIFNYKGMIISTEQDKFFIVDIQNSEPLSVLYTEIKLTYENSIVPRNAFVKSIDTKNINQNKTYVTLSFSDGNVIVLSIEKIRGKIETAIVDRFNMLEYHNIKSEDVYIAELYQNMARVKVYNLFNF